MMMLLIRSLGTVRSRRRSTETYRGTKDPIQSEPMALIRADLIQENFEKLSEECLVRRPEEGSSLIGPPQRGHCDEPLAN